jgi:plastocyanin
MGGLTASVASADVTVVDMTQQNQFLPQQISVEAGTTVQWTSSDTFMPHTVTADPTNAVSGGPNSDIPFPFGIFSGQTYSWEVPAAAVPGTTWFYHCRFHGSPGNGQSLGFGMTGSVTVKASAVQVGASPGLVQTTLAADQSVELMINSTNSHGDTPVYEWFVFTAVIGGNSIPVYLLSDIGVFDIGQVWMNLSAYTFTFDTSGVTSIANLSMSDLGMKAGDIFVYGYAYWSLSSAFVIDNIVFVVVH